jgi:hypothetical protein
MFPVTQSSARAVSFMMCIHFLPCVCVQEIVNRTCERDGRMPYYDSRFLIEYTSFQDTLKNIFRFRHIDF